MIQHITDFVRHSFKAVGGVVVLHGSASLLPCIVPVIAMLLVSVDQADLQTVCPGRRRSCALVNSPSPCVNKAIYHIQELKRKVEIWCQQVNC